MHRGDTSHLTHSEKGDVTNVVRLRLHVVVGAVNTAEMVTTRAQHLACSCHSCGNRDATRLDGREHRFILVLVCVRRTQWSQRKAPHSTAPVTMKYTCTPTPSPFSPKPKRNRNIFYTHAPESGTATVESHPRRRCRCRRSSARSQDDESLERVAARTCEQCLQERIGACSLGCRSQCSQLWGKEKHKPNPRSHIAHTNTPTSRLRPPLPPTYRCTQR